MSRRDPGEWALDRGYTKRYTTPAAPSSDGADRELRRNGGRPGTTFLGGAVADRARDGVRFGRFRPSGELL